MEHTLQPKAPKQRLLALDILRGITIAGMILVNNPGSWGNIYTPLEHAEWTGLTPTDLVFPFFMFIMGISTFISLRKFEFKPSWSLIIKIVRRTIVIFAIGIAITWLGKFLYETRVPLDPTLAEASVWKRMWAAACCFDHLRVLGVMPRLALCYGIASLVAIFVKHKFIPYIIGIFLAIYAFLLVCYNGYEWSQENIIYIIDNSLLGAEHLYRDTVQGITLSLDPEGLLSTIPSICHVLIGFMCGEMIMRTKDNDKRIEGLFIVGVILTFSGLLLSYGLPISKKVWSPTFALTTCGLASSLLGLLIWIIDIKGYKKWCRFFESFGINPLFMYVLGGVLSIISGNIILSTAAGEISLKGYIYKDVLLSIVGDPTFASFLYAILFVMFNWCIGYILYKKKIYIKI